MTLGVTPPAADAPVATEQENVIFCLNGGHLAGLSFLSCVEAVKDAIGRVRWR